MAGYTIVRRADAPDYSGDAPGAFLGYGRLLDGEQVSFNVKVLAPHESHRPPGFDPSWGHSHRTIEEVYLVLQGEVRMKLGDDIVSLSPLDAVLIKPETPRGVRNDTDEDAVFAMISVPVADPSAESAHHEGFWPES